MNVSIKHIFRRATADWMYITSHHQHVQSAITTCIHTMKTIPMTTSPWRFIASRRVPHASVRSGPKHFFSVSVYSSVYIQTNQKSQNIYCYAAPMWRYTAVWSICLSWSINPMAWLYGSTRSPGRIAWPREKAWEVSPSEIRAGGRAHRRCE